MAVPAKVPLLLVGATATSGLGIFTLRGLFASGEKKSIAFFLNTDLSKRVISKEDDSHWTKSAEAYKGSKNDVWNLGKEVSERIRNVCKEKLEFKVSGIDSDEYKNFISYCTRDTVISDLLKDWKETILSKNEGAGTKEWKGAWRRYIEDNKKLAVPNVWGVDNFDSIKDKVDQDAPESFRDRCESNLSSKDIFNMTLFENVKSWCTQPKVQ
ncbi:hypothetical protein MHC_04595 [Mycoplasma haemocanis str. Illinois]|uniref:Uncharacterized protein n=1 Tax=Mycoplasma haemocanis (strain Illinois) TaxID=1111676 RepID=H6N803_MYCHN|nr:hypothetical protein [Mycoplasma haemocanis]AEW45775.1 hypothetical protein MHC_04595 [Mycoplasma haemocanis str. Illinois]